MLSIFRGSIISVDGSSKTRHGYGGGCGDVSGAAAATGWEEVEVRPGDDIMGRERVIEFLADESRNLSFLGGECMGGFLK